MADRLRYAASLTQERLKELVAYDPETGVFTWKVNRCKAKAGNVAGYVNNGYVLMCIDGRMIYGHRLAWLYMQGAWPELHIDHINGNRSDNRLANLRDVSQAVNLQNIRAPRSDNKSGFLGVHLDKRTGKWVSAVRTNGRRLHLGSFETPQSASAAYLSAKRELHQGCTI